MSREGSHRATAPRLPTPRQVEVLRSRFRHGSRKEGAAALGIADQTARAHLQTLCRLLGVSSAYEAAYVLWLRDLWGE